MLQILHHFLEGNEASVDFGIGQGLLEASFCGYLGIIVEELMCLCLIGGG